MHHFLLDKYICLIGNIQCISTHCIYIVCTHVVMTKKIEMKTLLDTTRSRNIEIFLPTFPYPLVELTSTLDKQLNVVTETSELGLDHIIALKRCVCVCVCERERESVSVCVCICVV